MRTLGRRHREQVVPFEFDLPGARRHRPGDRLEQCRLAGSIGSDDRDELSLRDGQRNTPQRGQSAIAHREMVDRKHHAFGQYRSGVCSVVILTLHLGSCVLRDGASRLLRMRICGGSLGI